MFGCFAVKNKPSCNLNMKVDLLFRIVPSRQQTKRQVLFILQTMGGETGFIKGVHYLQCKWKWEHSL